MLHLDRLEKSKEVSLSCFSSLSTGIIHAPSLEIRREAYTARSAPCMQPDSLTSVSRPSCSPTRRYHDLVVIIIMQGDSVHDP